MSRSLSEPTPNVAAGPSELSPSKHIVDVLIEERAVGIRQHEKLWKLVRWLLDGFLGYKDAVSLIDACHPLAGWDVLEHMSQLLNMKVSTTGLENIPKEGRALVTPNHPAGVADGIAVFDALKTRRNDICFVANRDAIRVSPGLADVIIPVEWRVSERNAKKTRETVRAINQAFADERLVVIFPSGRLAQPTIRGLKERPWQTTALSFARRSESPVIPMHVKGENTILYYLAWYVNTELKDMTLFRELLRKQGRPYSLTIGEPFLIDQSLDVSTTTDRLSQFVLKELKHGKRHFNSA